MLKIIDGYKETVVDDERSVAIIREIAERKLPDRITMVFHVGPVDVAFEIPHKWVVRVR